MLKRHDYAARVVWNGNMGTGTSTYTGYARDYTVIINGKREMHGSADPMFRGSGDLHNPEDLFVASISTCHMLTYLALCARKGVTVLSYEDTARATLALDSNWGGKFEEVSLNPVVTIADPAMEEVAIALHEAAHRSCFISASVCVPIHHDATVRVAAMAGRR